LGGDEANRNNPPNQQNAHCHFEGHHLFGVAKSNPTKGIGHARARDVMRVHRARVVDATEKKGAKPL
jgi:hypothetical protein